jgi:hypothetical protein
MFLRAGSQVSTSSLRFQFPHWQKWDSRSDLTFLMVKHHYFVSKIMALGTLITWSEESPWRPSCPISWDSHRKKPPKWVTIGKLLNLQNGYIILGKIIKKHRSSTSKIIKTSQSSSKFGGTRDAQNHLRHLARWRPANAGYAEVVGPPAMEGKCLQPWNHSHIIYIYVCVKYSIHHVYMHTIHVKSCKYVF